MDVAETYRTFLKSDRWGEWEELETDQDRGCTPLPAQKPYPKDANLIDLSPPGDLKLGKMPVREAISRRRSRREFTDELLTVDELSYLLWATQGINWEATHQFRQWLVSKGTVVGEINCILRTVPSAGGLHPFETYLLLNRVSGLQPGLYRYLSVDHQLLFLRAAEELVEQAAQAFMPWVLRSAAIFIWATIPYRTEWRYSIVAHKMIAQESGHVCQNLYLACESIGAGACAITYDQDKVDALLGVDGIDEFTIYVAPVGKVTTAAYHFDH